MDPPLLPSDPTTAAILAAQTIRGLAAAPPLVAPINHSLTQSLGFQQRSFPLRSRDPSRVRPAFPEPRLAVVPGSDREGVVAATERPPCALRPSVLADSVPPRARTRTLAQTRCTRLLPLLQRVLGRVSTSTRAAVACLQLALRQFGEGLALRQLGTLGQPLWPTPPPHCTGSPSQSLPRLPPPSSSRRLNSLVVGGFLSARHASSLASRGTAAGLTQPAC